MGTEVAIPVLAMVDRSTRERQGQPLQLRQLADWSVVLKPDTRLRHLAPYSIVIILSPRVSESVYGGLCKE